MKIKLLIAICVFSFFTSATTSTCTHEKKGFDEGMTYIKEGHCLLASQFFPQLHIFGDEACGYGFEAAYCQIAAYLEIQDVRAFELSMQTLLSTFKRKAQIDRQRLLRAYAFMTIELSKLNSDLKRRWSLWIKRDKAKLLDQGSVELVKLHDLYVQGKHTKNP